MMKIQELIAVSGLPGLYKMAASRANGLIVEDLDSGKRKFVSMRKHQFSPLETIAVFTMTDSVALTEVLQKIHALREETPPVSHKSSNDDLRSYFREVLPEHDEYRVFPKDIKKIIKWYNFLNDRNLFEQFTDEEE